MTKEWVRIELLKINNIWAALLRENSMDILIFHDVQMAVLLDFKAMAEQVSSLLCAWVPCHRWSIENEPFIARYRMYLFWFCL